MILDPDENWMVLENLNDFQNFLKKIPEITEILKIMSGPLDVS